MKVILLFFFYSLVVFPQPEWVTHTPGGYLNDYFVGRGSSKNSKAEAEQFAMEDALAGIIRNGTITIQGTDRFNEEKNERMSNGNSVSFEIISKLAKEIIVSGSSVTVQNVKHVESYTEISGAFYNAYALISIPKKNPSSPPTAFSPVWRSTLLPGWGQLYKGETFKGLSFLTLTIGGVAGGLVLSQLSIDASNNAISSRTQARRDFFNKEKKDYLTYGILSFIGAGVFYVWNVVDAIIVKQENLYVQFYQEADKLNFQISYNF